MGVATPSPGSLREIWVSRKNGALWGQLWILLHGPISWERNLSWFLVTLMVLPFPIVPVSVNLTQTRVAWKEKTSTEELPLWWFE